MKKALALVSIIIMIISIIPTGAFADDNYPDHSNNLPPYVQGLMGMFQSNSSYSITFSDFEGWYNGVSVGTVTGTDANFGTYYDTLDVDFQFYYPASVINQTLLFEFYLTDVNNIDYIEMYSQSTYEAHSVCYYTYAGDSLYVVVVGGTIDGLNNTLRIHFKGNHAYTISRVGNFGTVKIHDNSTASSAQYNLANWMYWGAMLKELESINSNLNNNYNTNWSDISDSIDVIEDILKGMRYGYNKYLYNNSSYYQPLVRIYSLNTDGSIASNSTTDIYSTSSGTSGLYSNFAIACKFDWNYNKYPYFKVYIPVTNNTASISGRTIHCSITIGSMVTANTYQYISFENEYSDYVTMYSTTSNNQNFLVFNCFYPQNTALLTGSSGQCIYIRVLTDSTSNWCQFPLSISYDNSSFYTWGTTNNSQVGYENTSILYFDKIYKLIHDIADNTQYVDPPASSDPITNIENIYDIDIEFNNTIGDISVFESTYQQQLNTYDQTISSQYLVPISSSYDFNNLNQEFGYIWSQMFSYDIDENDNITGVYGLGLYFLIPIILFVICALFRRVTS